jgi:hypothetical protein
MLETHGRTADSPSMTQLIFPSASYTKNCTFEPVLGGTQGEQVTKAFSQVVGG